MPHEVGGDTPVSDFKDLFVEDLPMCLVHMHGSMEPMRHRLERFIVVIKERLCIYFSNVQH